jgi:hypothetical protein
MGLWHGRGFAVMALSTNHPVDELAACKVRLRLTSDRLASCVDDARASGARLAILSAIQEVEELQRWTVRGAAFTPPIGHEPFNLSPEEIEREWSRQAQEGGGKS